MKKQKNFNLSTELIDAIGKESLKLGINTSEYAERALRAYLAGPAKYAFPDLKPSLCPACAVASVLPTTPEPLAEVRPTIGSYAEPYSEQLEDDDYYTASPARALRYESGKNACAVCMGMGVFHAQRGKMEHCENCGGTGVV